MEAGEARECTRAGRVFGRARDAGLEHCTIRFIE